MKTESPYIPKDIKSSFLELKKMLGPKGIKDYLEIKDGSCGNIYHNTLGRELRNRWGLWHCSRLAGFFNGMGIYHPDDMSNIILKSFYNHLNNKPLDVETQVDRYKKYWIDMGVDVKKECGLAEEK